MKKRIFFIFMIILLLSPVQSVRAQEVTLSFGKWDTVENDSGLTLTAYHSDETEEDMIIPEVLGGKPVTGLGKELFQNNYQLRSVFIPDSVASIGANAFNGCVSLTDVRLPLNLKRIDSGTFRYCYNLENIFIPFSVTNISGSAFADCVRLREVNLIAVTTLGESAFDNCQSLRTVTVSRKLNNVGGYAFRDTPWLDAQTDEYVIIGDGVLVKYNGNADLVNVPAGVTLISGAFEGNHQLKDVFLPDTLKKIGQYAFKNALNLRHVTIPEFVTAIDSGAFDGCLNLAEIDIPYRVNTIGGNAFRGCESLQEVVLPAQLKRINNGSFANCTALKQLLIPAGVTEIQQNAFSGTDGLTLMVSYGSAGELFATLNGIKFSYDIQQTDDLLYTKDKTGIHILRYIGKANDVKIPSEIEGTKVIEVGSGAFQFNNHVYSVAIPLGVETIGNWAFSYMSSLESVDLPITLSGIGANAFTGSSALKEIMLPDHLKDIGEKAFGSGMQIALHAGEASETEQLLTSLGLEVTPTEDPAQVSDEELSAVRTMLSEINSTEVIPDSGTDAADVPAAEPAENTPAENTEAEDLPTELRESVYLDYQILRIPDETTVLSKELLDNAEKNLILLIPDSVITIEEEILEDRSLLIIGNTGSAAEAFASEHDVPFLVRYTGWWMVNY